MRALGVDYGRRRIGLALSDATGVLARPWKAIAGAGPLRSAAAVAAEIDALTAEDERIHVVVLGLPRRLSGEPTEQTAAVIAMAERLRTLVAAPVFLQDERLSSREAERVLAEREKDWRKRKALIDAAAAAVILQDYLDGLPRSQAAPGDDEGEGV